MSGGTTLAVGGMRDVPAPDPIARDYLLLALRLDQHVPGLVDGYFGPADIKAAVDLEQLRSPARLRDDARSLLDRLPAEVADRGRRTWLAAQLRALETQAQALAGDPFPYLEHVERCFDWRPEPVPADALAAAAAEVEQLLPGSGSLEARLAAWDERTTIPPGRVPEILAWLVAIFRERARTTFGLPAGEDLRTRLVTDKPWSGYNWYDGGLRSRVEINTDLPIRAPLFPRVVAHETYPGHHLEHAWKEAQAVLVEGRMECSIQLINTPECLVSEGLANLGYRFAVPPDTEAQLLAELFERAGIEAGPNSDLQTLARTAAALRGPRTRLEAIGGNAAILRHVEGWERGRVVDYCVDVGRQPRDRAEQRLDFIEHPLWRTYVFVYHEGEQLLARWLEAVPQAARAERFGRLLREPLTPSMIAAELAGTPS